MLKSSYGRIIAKGETAGRKTSQGPVKTGQWQYGIVLRDFKQGT